MFVFSQKTVSVMVVDGIRDDPFMLDTSVDGDWCSLSTHCDKPQPLLG